MKKQIAFIFTVCTLLFSSLTQASVSMTKEQAFGQVVEMQSMVQQMSNTEYAAFSAKYNVSSMPKDVLLQKINDGLEIQSENGLALIVALAIAASTGGTPCDTDFRCVMLGFISILTLDGETAAAR